MIEPVNGKDPVHVPNWNLTPAYEVARLLWPEVPWAPTQNGLIVAAQVRRFSRNPADFPGVAHGLKWVLQDKGAGILVGVTMLNFDVLEDLGRVEYRLKTLGFRDAWATRIAGEVARRVPTNADADATVLDVVAESLALVPATRAAAIFFVVREAFGQASTPAAPKPPSA